VNFSSRKNPTASVGSEPAILGTRGRIRSPDRPVCIESLYQLNYPVPRVLCCLPISARSEGEDIAVGAVCVLIDWPSSVCTAERIGDRL
jgi:hypothetical protein